MGIILAILILLIMITIHEFGHYLAGKILGFKINEFSIGFGPAIFKRKSKKTDEQFSVRLIPLGGYCAFAGEEEDEEENAEEETDGEDDVSDVFVDMRKEEGEKSQPTAQTLPLKIEEKANEAAQTGEKSGKFNEMAPWKRIIVLLAGATMNYLLSLVFILSSFGFFGELLIGAYQVETTDAVAQEYCLQDGDIIFKVESQDIYMSSDLISALKDRKEGDRVEMTVSRIVKVNPDKTNVREEKQIAVQLRGDTHFEHSADVDKLWEALGIAKERDEQGNVKLNENGDVVYKVASYRCKFGFFETIGRGCVYSVRIAASIFQVFGDLLTGKLGVDAMGGPLTTIKATSQIASMGVQPFLEIASYIGVNLAVFNLLPLPALDGSKVIFTSIEWVRGKPINRKVEAVIHTVGMLLLFAFAIFVDVLQFI